MVYTQPRICPGKWEAQTPLGFWNTNGLPNLSQTNRPHKSQKMKIENKENLPNCGLRHPGLPQSKIERKWKEG